MFAGAGAIVVNTEQQGVITHVGIAATFGLVVMVMIYAVGHISGGHFNPGVTLELAASRHFPLTHVLPYWAAKFVAAIAAASALRLMFGDVVDLGATQPSGSAVQSFTLEIRPRLASS